MAAPVVESIDALLGGDPRTLDDDQLKHHLRGIVAVRARADAALMAATAEFDQRDAYVADGMLNARAWLAHHTAIGRATAGSIVWLAKRLRYMPAFAAALSDGAITYDHARLMATALNPRTLEPFVRGEALLLQHATTLEADVSLTPSRAGSS